MTYPLQKRPKEQVRRKRFSASVYAGIIVRQDGKCACCGEPLGDDPRDIEFDHELELWRGGKDAPENLRALKKKHHMQKTRGEAAELAKTRRIESKGGHRRRNLSAADKELLKKLEAR